ncbi:DedA family protein [Flavihumibacter petaseus NBRC 106054]|uniref:DedA family protein n=2 Tax=Flavihumibacter TaxID=1004301 RepID=A0A0E9MZH9_9BACT|nr:DedA family protein [Flavihumibacter petaseus NBRC 106054]
MLAAGVLICGIVAGQEEHRIQLINQYESAVGQFQLHGPAGIRDFTTDQDGFVTIPIDTAVEYTVTAAAHDTLKFRYSELGEGRKVKMVKPFSWKDLLNPMFYISYGGLWLLLIIVFAETGLFVGFFLPGDSLLFVAGIYSTNLSHEFLKTFGLGELRSEWVDLLLLVGLISFVGIIGNTVGFWFGRKIGPTMFKWKDNLLFKQRYLVEAHDFYEKHGGGAIVFARFLPIVRTFAPIIAGIVGMDKKKFAFYNIVGCVAWVFSMLFAGHFLQKWVKTQFGFDLRDHLEVIVIVIVLVTTAPVIWKLVTGRDRDKSTA